MSYIKTPGAKSAEGCRRDDSQDLPRFNRIQYNAHPEKEVIFTAPCYDSLYGKSYKLSTKNWALFLHRLLIQTKHQPTWMSQEVRINGLVQLNISPTYNWATPWGWNFTHFDPITFDRSPHFLCPSRICRPHKPHKWSNPGHSTCHWSYSILHLGPNPTQGFLHPTCNPLHTIKSPTQVTVLTTLRQLVTFKNLQEGYSL